MENPSINNTIINSNPTSSPPQQRYQFTIHTYGCKVNTYDTGLLQKRLEAQGHSAVPSEFKASHQPLAHSMAQSAAQISVATTVTSNSSLANFGLGARVPRIHILNTCAVTAEATKEAAKLVRRLKSRDPFSTVVVTGCGAQVDGTTYDSLVSADLIVANSHKGSLERLLDQHFSGLLNERVFRSNIFRKDDLEAGGGIEAGHTRAFVKIQDGCNSFCTYCVIPFARGKSRSLSVAELVTRVRDLHSQGVSEVVLTGVHIGDYEDIQNVAGEKKRSHLHDLLAELLVLTDIPRFRLTSLEPPELTPELMALFKNERVCPHFHMSIQSASTPVLKGMKRQYDALAVESALRTIAAELPQAFVGMDVIVGFPGETEEMFQETYERLAALPWTKLHVFPYSERPGTKAALFDEMVPRDKRLLRSQRLRELSRERFDTIALKQIGTTKKAMILRSPGKGAEGLTRDYWPVKMISALVTDASAAMSAEQMHQLAALKGREVNVKIVDYDDSHESRMEGVLVGIYEEAGAAAETNAGTGAGNGSRNVTGVDAGVGSKSHE
jgi:threonylcarbamoyladenosine tRNA methylthiotransferase MtaB